MTTYRNLIVTAADADLARSIAAGLDPTNCSGMFTTGLCPTGTSDITHYISSGLVSDGFAALVPLATWAQDEDGEWFMTAYDDGDPVTVAYACQALDPPLEVTDVEVEEMFAASDVTTQEPFVAMGRLGLVLWQPPTDAEPAEPIEEPAS